MWPPDFPQLLRLTCPLSPHLRSSFLSHLNGATRVDQGSNPSNEKDEATDKKVRVFDFREGRGF